MLKIGDKTFLNLQEAVGWLMENNCIPFQCTAPYAANTEIGMGTIVNPSPAKVRIGSIIFFSDSKVSTVTGITQNGFVVSDHYNDLVDDVVYVKNVAISGNGHLIVTLSNDDVIDAGLIKQVSGFSVDGLQHLIALYNDGSAQDLGAIFSGNVNIAGDFTADSIIENMVGYSYTPSTEVGVSKTPVYVGCCKNGNKLTMVLAFKMSFDATHQSSKVLFGRINIPSSVYNKINTISLGSYQLLNYEKADAVTELLDTVSVNWYSWKGGGGINFEVFKGNLEANKNYYIRLEITFLLNASMA